MQMTEGDDTNEFTVPKLKLKYESYMSPQGYQTSQA